MGFIQVGKDLFLNYESIEGIQRDKKGGLKVLTSNRSYTVDSKVVERLLQNDLRLVQSSKMTKQFFAV